MDEDARHAAVVESLKATASELQARPSEEMNRDWADRMADGLAVAGLLAAADQDHDETAGRATSPQVTALADEGYFSDLTARLAAADAGWCLTYGDERADPAYIRWLARQVDAFEDHASPAAPADDEAAAVRVAAIMRAHVGGGRFTDAGDAYCVCGACVEDWHYHWSHVALAALREGQQQ